MSIETREEILSARRQEKASALAELRSPVYATVARTAGGSKGAATKIISLYEAGADYGAGFHGPFSQLDDAISDHLIRAVQSGHYSGDEMYRNILYKDRGGLKAHASRATDCPASPRGPVAWYSPHNSPSNVTSYRSIGPFKEFQKPGFPLVG